MQTLEAELVQFKYLIIFKTNGLLMVRQARVESRIAVKQGKQIHKGVGKTLMSRDQTQSKLWVDSPRAREQENRTPQADGLAAGQRWSRSLD